MHKRILAFALLFFLAASSFAPNFSSAQAADPIKHIIFILQENHSFDNYFGTYPGANNLSFAPPCCPTSLSATAQPAAVKPFHLNVSQPVDIVGDELPPGQMYPNASDVLTASSGDVAPFQLPTESSADLLHSWQAAHTAWNNGSMNGFVVGEANNQTMGYYTRSDIPYYFDYANNYVLDDNFYSSLLGPSFPNHLYMVSGTSGNITGNPKSHGPDFTLSQYFNLTWTQIAQELTQAGVSWKWYTGQANVTAPSYWDVPSGIHLFPEKSSDIEGKCGGHPELCKLFTKWDATLSVVGHSWQRMAPAHGPVHKFPIHPELRYLGTSAREARLRDGLRFLSGECGYEQPVLEFYCNRHKLG